MKKLCIIDRFLIVFALIFLLYSAVHLVFGMTSSQEANTVDIIVRTSLASILGYFISSNFTKSDALPEKTTLSSVDIPEKLLSTEPEKVESPIKTPNTIQIYIVASLGLLSLVILIAARHSSNLTPELIATISQLRDFVSACIGFLISHKKSSPD